MSDDPSTWFGGGAPITWFGGGVPRDDLVDEDVEEWAGAEPDVEARVDDAETWEGSDPASWFGGGLPPSTWFGGGLPQPAAAVAVPVETPAPPVEPAAPVERPPAAPVEIPRPARRERPPRRRLLVGTLAVFVVALVWAVGAALSLASGAGALLEARGSSVEARQALRGGDVEGARVALGAAAAQFDDADRSLSNPFSWVAGWVPSVGRNVRAAAGITEAGALLSGGLLGLFESAEDLPDGIASLLPRDGAVPVDHIAALGPAAEEAVVAAEAAEARLERTPSTGLLPRVAEAREEVADVLAPSARSLRSGAALVRALPALFGADQPKRYLFAASNPAELRGTGGFLGAHTVLSVDEGELVFGEFVSTIDLERVPGDEIEAPTPEFADRVARYGGPGNWVNLNMTADFPLAATALTNLWAHANDEELDGVIVADPYLLQALVDDDEPLAIESVGEIRAGDLAEFTLNTAYDELTDPDERKRLLGMAAARAVQRFLEGDEDALESFSRVADAAGDGHLLVHSRDSEVQGALEAAGLAGALREPAAGEDALAVVVNTGSANKVDFYTERRLDYTVRLRPDGSAHARLVAEFHNDAPTSGIDSYVIGPNFGNLEAGDTLFDVSVYCAGDCELSRFRRDHGEGGTRVEQERGRAVFTARSVLGSGETGRMQWDWTVDDAWSPDEGYRLAVEGQPTVRPTELTVAVRGPRGTEFDADGEEWQRQADDHLVWSGTEPYRDVLELPVGDESERTLVERLRDWLAQPVVRLGLLT